MSIVLSIMGRKGGITKTTIAKTLAAGAALRGYRTILVDADGQGNASSGVRVTPYDGFKQLIQDDAEWADVLRPVSDEFLGGEGEMFVLPASNAQRLVESDPEAPASIIERFQEIRTFSDVVIVDTSPGINNIHVGLYYASDYVLLPTLCEFDSILSLGTTLEYLHNATASGVEAGYSVAGILGIIPNRFNASENVQKVNVGFVRGQYYDKYRVFNPIRDLTVWRQASQTQESIYSLSKTGSYRERRDATRAQKEFQPVLDTLLKLVDESKVSA
jgi:chromosome partitioning protein